MKNQKGITLVALILIIVVLLILAGISISLVVKNEPENVGGGNAPVVENSQTEPENEEINVEEDKDEVDNEDEVAVPAEKDTTVDVENTVDTNTIPTNDVKLENVVE